MFLARCLTQLLLSLAVDVESNPGPSQVCAMPTHVKIGAVHVPNCNIAPTLITLTQTPHKQQ